MKAKPLALVALLFVVTAELLRASGPLLDAVAGQIGILPAAGVAIGLFTLPGALLGTLRRASLPGMILLLLLVRLTAQFAPNVAIVGAGAVLGLVTLGLAVQRSPDATTAGAGMLAGGVLDLAIRSLTLTWDPIWIGWIGLPMVALVAVALWLSLSVGSGQPLGRVWAAGAALALWTTTVGNPAVVASQSGLGLQLSILVIMAALVVGVEAVRRAALLPLAGLIAGAALVGGVGLAWWDGAVGSLVGVVLAVVGGAVAFTRAVAISSQRGNTLLGLVWVLPVLLYQLHYDIPLPFDNRLLLLLVAVGLGLAGAGRRARAVEPSAAPVRQALPVLPGMVEVTRRRFGAVQPVTAALALALLLPLGIFLAPQEPATASPDGSSMRLLSWNIKYGRDDASGHVDPRQIAEVIRSADADLVVLQEVSRGWAIGGGVDVAEYLSAKLDMSYYWAPAADNQFGNLVLAPRGSLPDASHALLPYGQGPMWRSYVRVRAGGFDIVATHLTHKKQNTPTRLDQIDTILREKPDLVVGDLNFWPTWDERRAFTAADYQSAQDILQMGTLYTSPTNRPTNRVDWVFGDSDVRFTGFWIMTETRASDHFPILTVFSRSTP